MSQTGMPPNRPHTPDLTISLSNFGRANYDERLAKNRDNVLDIIQRTGVDVMWIENDGGCKGVCDKVPTIARDEREPDLWRCCRDRCRYCGGGELGRADLPPISQMAWRAFASYARLGDGSVCACDWDCCVC